MARWSVGASPIPHKFSCWYAAPPGLLLKSQNYAYQQEKKPCEIRFPQPQNPTQIPHQQMEHQRCARDKTLRQLVEKFRIHHRQPCNHPHFQRTDRHTAART